MLQILNDDCFYRTKKGKFNLELCKQYENKSNIKCIDFNRDNNSKQTNNIGHKYTHSHIKYNNINNHIMFFACTRVLIEYFSPFFMKIEEKKTSINFYKINHLLKWDEKKWLEILYSKKEHVYTIHTYDNMINEIWVVFSCISIYKSKKNICLNLIHNTTIIAIYCKTPRKTKHLSDTFI